MEDPTGYKRLPLTNRVKTDRVEVNLDKFFKLKETPGTSENQITCQIGNCDWSMPTGKYSEKTERTFLQQHLSEEHKEVYNRSAQGGEVEPSAIGIKAKIWNWFCTTKYMGNLLFISSAIFCGAGIIYTRFMRSSSK